MSKAGHHQVGTGARVALLMVCVALLALLISGCSGGGSDQKAQLETVGKFYAAQGALDLPALKAALYDPKNISGIATATVPPGAQKTEIAWKSVGDTVVITIPSQSTTLTASIAKSPPNAVLISDGSGQGQAQTLIMKKDGDVWKIDVAETEKASKAAAPSGQGAPSGQAPPSGGNPAPTKP